MSFLCPLSLLDEAAADGSNLLWAQPYAPSPLVHGEFRDRGVMVGMNGQTLSESEIKGRGVNISLQDGRLEVRVPLGASGGHIKVCKLSFPTPQAVSTSLRIGLMCFPPPRVGLYGACTASPCQWICSL